MRSAAILLTPSGQACSSDCVRACFKDMTHDSQHCTSHSRVQITGQEWQPQTQREKKSSRHNAQGCWAQTQACERQSTASVAA